MVQLSHPSMTTGKTIALTILTFVSKVMSLLFNTLRVHWYLQVVGVLIPAKQLKDMAQDMIYGP